MSENAPESTDAPEAPESTEQQGEEALPEWARKKLEKANREAANYRSKVRELEPLASRARELEDAGRSDTEKLTARAEMAERELQATRMQATRLEVAFEKGLTPAQAKRLVGSTREELEADADEVLRDFPVKSGRPSGDIGQGPRTDAPPTDPRAADLWQIEQDLKRASRA